MRKIDKLLAEYGESHQNHTNKTIHWMCIPLIMFSLFGLLYSIPFVTEKGILANWAAVVLAVALIYYFRLSFPMFLGFAIIGGIMLIGVDAIHQAVNYSSSKLALISAAVFAVAWIGQFVGHKIEGEKPSFFKDLQFLLIGPAWLLHFIFERSGISY